MQMRSRQSCPTNLKMKGTESRSVLNYLEKIGMTLKVIHVDMVQTLTVESPCQATLNKWIVKFKHRR